MRSRPFVVLAVVSLAGCAADPCTVKEAADGSAVISCPDGSVATLAPGQDGADGAPGSDGDDGATGQSGADGGSILVRTDTEPAGANCPEGGVAVRVGTDDDADGALADTEVESTSYVCDGVDGHDTLVRTDAMAPDDTCPAGGTVIVAGADSDDDGVLSESEIQTTAYVCHGTVPDVYLAFPSADASTRYGTAGDYGAYYEAGDFLRQTFTATGMVSVSALEVASYIVDGTDSSYCTVGTLGFDVSLNGTVVGSFDYEGGFSYGYVYFDESFAFSRILGTGPTGDDYEVAITATTTVCPGGGAWQWYPYGNTTLSM